MKCDIVKDLLPLYIENLCSSASREAVEEHLEHCETCREEYERMRREYELPLDSMGEEAFIEEKNLLEKSKQELETSFANRIMGNFFSIVSVLGLLINSAMVIITFLMYRYRYPRFYFKELGSAHVWLFILPFLPTLLAFAGRTAVSHSQKKTIIPKLLFAGTIPAILLGGFCTLFFVLIPPISSSTGNPANYMKIDGDTGKFERDILDFYPGQIPVNAKQTDYFYRRYSSIFSESLEIEASWALPADEYAAAKEQALGLGLFKNSRLSESGGNGTIISRVPPGKVTVVFEYDDRAMRVSYRAYADWEY